MVIVIASFSRASIFSADLSLFPTFLVGIKGIAARRRIFGLTEGTLAALRYNCTVSWATERFASLHIGVWQGDHISVDAVHLDPLGDVVQRLVFPEEPTSHVVADIH